MTVQVRDGGGLDQGNDSELGRRVDSLDRFLKVKPRGLPDESNEGWERKQGVRFGPELLEGMELLPTDLGKNMGRAGLGKIKSSVLRCKFEMPTRLPSGAG